MGIDSIAEQRYAQFRSSRDSFSKEILTLTDQLAEFYRDLKLCIS